MKKSKQLEDNFKIKQRTKLRNGRGGGGGGWIDAVLCAIKRINQSNDFKGKWNDEMLSSV